MEGSFLILIKGTYQKLQNSIVKGALEAFPVK